MEEQKHMQELESSVKHRFVNMTELLSQKAVGKNLVVDNIWWS